MSSALSCIARSKILTCIALSIYPVIAVVNLVLSIEQTQAIDKNVIIRDASTGKKVDWSSKYCDQLVIQNISPFYFSVKFGDAGDSGDLGCPWRLRNSVMRISVCAAMVVFAVASLVILCRSPPPSPSRRTTTTDSDRRQTSYHTQSAADPERRCLCCRFRVAWNVVSYLHFLVLLLLFAVFVLDCDGLNTGVASCNEHFIVQGTAIISFNDRKPDQCFLTPYVYVVFADVACLILGFLNFLLHRSRYTVFYVGVGVGVGVDGSGMVGINSSGGAQRTKKKSKQKTGKLGTFLGATFLRKSNNNNNNTAQVVAGDDDEDANMNGDNNTANPMVVTSSYDD